MRKPQMSLPIWCRMLYLEELQEGLESILHPVLYIRKVYRKGTISSKTRHFTWSFTWLYQPMKSWSYTELVHCKVNNILWYRYMECLKSLLGDIKVKDCCQMTWDNHWYSALNLYNYITTSVFRCIKSIVCPSWNEHIAFKYLKKSVARDLECPPEVAKLWTTHLLYYPVKYKYV